MRLACIVLVCAEGRQAGWPGLGEGQDSSRGRVSLKWSWEGEPTWAAAGPDGS